MSDERRLVISTDPSFTPDDISRRTFGTAFRGWDPNEVKAYLARVGKELAASQQRVRQLERELRDVSSRANHPELDEATITSALGEEAARILRTAREAGSDIKGRAEENAERAIRQGQDEAKRIRSEAEAVLADRLKEAEEAAEVLRQAAEAEGQRIIEDAKAHSRDMVHEAQGLRAKVLGDLARRRKLAQVQVAQLRAGRERLLDAYRTVRRTLDEVSDELQRADAEARLAAEQAAIRASDLPEASVEDLAAGLTPAMPAALQEAPPEPEPEPEAAPAPERPAASQPPAPAPAPAAETVEAQKVPPPQPEQPAARPKHMTKAQKKAERRAEREREAQEAARHPAPQNAPKPAPPKPAPAKAAPTAPPATPAAEMEIERTSSSLRLLRGPKPPAPTVTTSSGAELEVVEASSDIETVRVIPSASSPEPATPDAGVPEQAEIVPEAAPTPAEQPAAEAEESAAKTEEPEAPEADAQPAEEKPPAEEEPEPEAEPADEDTAAAAAEPQQPVDDLFARLRADRAAAVEKAQQVLQEATAPAAAPEAPDAPERESAVASIDDGHIRRRDGELQPIEATLSRRLKRGLQDDQNELLDRLRSHRGPITVDAVLADAGEHAERFRQVGRDLLVQAARAGTAFAGTPGTPTPDLTDLVGALAEAVVTPLRGRLERGLREALAEGDDEGVLVERVGAAYREWKSQRIEQLAADQVLAAFGRGLMAATAPGTPLRWIVRDTGGPCPDCDDNALAGAVPSGDTWPTGQVHPPAHPGCRCLLVPAPH